MIYSLIMYATENVNDITSAQFRKAIIDKCEKLPKESLSKIINHIDTNLFKDFKNAKIRRYPHVIFSNPHAKELMLRFFEDEGFGLLMEVKKEIFNNDNEGYLEINNKKIKLKSFKITNQPLFPNYLGESTKKYKIVRPLILHAGTKRKSFDYIYFNNQDDLVKREQEFKENVTKLMRAKLIGIFHAFKGDGNYDFLNSLEIKWHTFKIAMIQDKGSNIPAIYGSFESNWSLPPAFGDRISAGYGQLITLKEFEK